MPQLQKLGNKLPYEPTRPAGFVRPEFAGQAVPTVWHMSHECGTMWMYCQTNLKMQPSAGGVATQTRTVPDRKPPTSSLHPRLLHRTSELCVLTQSCQLPFGHAWQHTCWHCTSVPPIIISHSHRAAVFMTFPHSQQFQRPSRSEYGQLGSSGHGGVGTMLLLGSSTVSRVKLAHEVGFPFDGISGQGRHVVAWCSHARKIRFSVHMVPA